MKVYLDDVRPTPEGWIRTYWADETIKHLNTGKVKELSLDHDLGDDDRSTGYNVLTWLEEEVFSGSWQDKGFDLPLIYIHSQNPVGVEKMEKLVNRINRKFYEK